MFYDNTYIDTFDWGNQVELIIEVNELYESYNYKDWKSCKSKVDKIIRNDEGEKIEEPSKKEVTKPKSKSKFYDGFKK